MFILDVEAKSDRTLDYYYKSNLAERFINFFMLIKSNGIDQIKSS